MIPIAAEIVDNPPKDQAALNTIRAVIRCQAEQIWKATEQLRKLPKVQCPCGKQARMDNMFQCFHCGIYYCRACGPRHFGPAPSLIVKDPA